jgi:hypothetical protein
MQDLAPIEQQTTAPLHKPTKLPRIAKRITQAIELIITGTVTTQKAAAERVGITPEHLSRMLSRDHVRVFIERRARQTIAAGQMRASARLVELVDAGSEHVSLDATKHMLGISGIAPAPATQVNVNIELKAGYVIDLSERIPGNEQIIEHDQTNVCPPVGETK